MRVSGFCVIVISCLFSLISFGKALEAHVHGVVRIDMANEKNELLVMIKAPAESFLGFEYKAKTSAEKDLVKKTQQQWKKNILEYLGEDALKDCKVTQSSWKQEFSGKSHSSIIAESYIRCESAIKSRKLKISFKEKYKNIQKIKFHLIREDGSVLNQVKTEDVFTISF